MIKCSSCGAENADDASYCGQCGQKLTEQSKPQQQTEAEPERVGDIRPDIDSAETVGMFDTVDRKARKVSKELEFNEGDVFAGRYTIKSLIGRGGMGVVYRAVDRHGERDVALKLIRPDRLAGPAAVKRLIAEGVTTQELAHPNIVRVYNVDEADGVPFVAMEFVAGDTLAEWHRKRIATRDQVPVRVAARIVMEVLAGLEAAHDADIIHRDLKPQNIIVIGEPDEKKATIKILDFGIAQVAGTEETMGGTALGTLAYMAPEQRTDPDLVDPSSDLFALSKIFYKLLMDALPDTMWQPPSASRSEVPEQVDQLILAGISVHRNSRPGSVEEYRQRLLAAMNSKTNPSPRPTPHPTPTPVDPNGLHTKASDPTSEFMQGPGKPLGIGCLALIGIVFVVFVIDVLTDGGITGECYDDEYCYEPTPQPYVSSGGGNVVPDPEPVPEPEPLPPPPPPPPSRYAKLGGSWYSELANEPVYYTVEDDGSFRSQGTDLALGIPFTVTGRFSGNVGSYQYRSELGVFQGELLWDGADCHLVDRLNVNGQVISVEMHINHRPGAPCPAGF
ncbi:MAG: serine/threonine-protein kinase [Pseudomonadota bacterium]